MTDKIEKKAKPVFDTLTCTVTIRVDGDAAYYGSDLATELEAMRLPIHVQYTSPDQVTFTYSFTFPPSKQDQQRLVEHLVNQVVSRRPGVTKTLTF